MNFTAALYQVQAPAKLASCTLRLIKVCESVPDFEDNTQMRAHVSALQILHMAGLTCAHHLLQRVDRACAILMMLEEYDMHSGRDGRVEKTLERESAEDVELFKLERQAREIVEELRALVRELHGLVSAPGTGGAAVVQAMAVESPETATSLSLKKVLGVDVVRLSRRTNRTVVEVPDGEVAPPGAMRAPARATM